MPDLLLHCRQIQYTRVSRRDATQFLRTNKFAFTLRIVEYATRVCNLGTSRSTEINNFVDIEVVAGSGNSFGRSRMNEM